MEISVSLCLIAWSVQCYIQVNRALRIYHYLKHLVFGCHNKKHNLSILKNRHFFTVWEVGNQGQGASSARFWGGLSYWLVDGTFLLCPCMRALSRVSISSKDHGFFCGGWGVQIASFLAWCLFLNRNSYHNHCGSWSYRTIILWGFFI